MVLETDSPLLNWTDVRCALIIAICVAIGTSLALTLAASIFPTPTTITGGHHIILDSQIAQARLEPREKAFYILAVIFSFIFGLVGSVMHRHFLSANWIFCACISLDILILNYFSNNALNLQSGLYWGASAFLLNCFLALVTVFGGRFKCLSYK